MKASEKDISPLLRAAMMAHQQGAVGDARRLYEQALRAAPRHPDALHLLGLTWIDAGQAERGLQLIRRAIAYRPDYLEAINNIAIELAKLGRHAEARDFLQRAVRLNDFQPDVHYNLGRSLNALGDFQAALASYDRAVALRPDHHEAWNNRGITLYALRDLEGALASYDRALALKPDYHEAWTSRGMCLRELDRFDEALGSFDNAIAAKPDFHEAWLQRANTLSDSERHEETLAAYDRAIALNPTGYLAWIGRALIFADMNRYQDATEALDKAATLHAEDCEILTTRALILSHTGRPEEALICAERAIALQPDSHKAWAMHGNALHNVKRVRDALVSYEKALALYPDEPNCQTDRAYSLLSLGELAEGWRAYTYRNKTRSFRNKRPDIAVPDWRGESLIGKRILIFSEQGIGDILQFSRYIPLVRARGADAIFVAPPKVYRMLRGTLDGVRVITQQAQIGTPDFLASLMDLPAVFETGLGSIPAQVPYLSAEPELCARWRSRLGTTGRRIGIAWQGNLQAAVDIGRSFPLAHFAALADLPGLRLISLQKGFGTEQLANLPAGMKVETLGDDFDSGPDAFIDTAAVMQSLDLIITSDTAIAHLAGALGRPVWVALKYVPDWRWMQDRADSPWYPTMRLFRQPAPGDWNSVFRDIRAALEEAHG